MCASFVFFFDLPTRQRNATTDTGVRQFYFVVATLTDGHGRTTKCRQSLGFSTGKLQKGTDARFADHGTREQCRGVRQTVRSTSSGKSRTFSSSTENEIHARMYGPSSRINRVGLFGLLKTRGPPARRFAIYDGISTNEPRPNGRHNNGCAGKHAIIPRRCCARFVVLAVYYRRPNSVSL